MPVDRTRLKSRGLDRRRARLGLGDDLELIKYATTSGYTVFQTISSGWSGQKVTDASVGQEFFEVRIAGDGPLDLAQVFRTAISHLKVGEFYYKFSGVDAPRQGAVRIWIVRCAPTGERQPS